MGTTSNPLKDVDSFKDLGVTVTRDLSWAIHINNTVSKANKMLGIIKRSVGTANKDIISMLYISFVRPILEYAAPVWNPYLVKTSTLWNKFNVERLGSPFVKKEMKWHMKKDVSYLDGRSSQPGDYIYL